VLFRSHGTRVRHEPVGGAARKRRATGRPVGMRRGLVLLLAGGLAVLFFVVTGSRAGTDRQSKPPHSSGSAEPPQPVALTSGWRFRADGHRSWHPVAIPNDYNPTVNSRGDRGSVGWYEVRFSAPASSSGRSWSVHFESVRRNATVWLNGYKIGHSSDPYAPFTLPATTLVPGARNTLAVRVDNLKGPGTLPEDWWNWGGIMGPVELRPVGRASLNELEVTPELGCGYRCGALLVRGTLTNNAAQALQPTVVVRVTSPDGRTSET